MRRNPVDLFLDRDFVKKSPALQDRLAVLDHFRMPTQIRDRVVRVEFPVIGILSQDVVSASGFARPIFMIPWATYGRNVLKPGQLFVELR